MIFSVLANQRRSSQGISGFQDRRQSLFMGLPAAVLALVGLSLLFYSSGDPGKLERRYQRMAEDALNERSGLETRFRNKRRQDNLTVVENEIKDQDALDQLQQSKVEIFEAYARERLYWEKLLSIQPNENRYLFNIAQSCLSESNFRREIQSADQLDHQTNQLLLRGRSLMNALAKPNEMGYPPAHLWWAKSISEVLRDPKLPQQQAEGLARMAISHAGHFLSREPNDKEGLVIKSRLALFLRDWREARNAVSILFQTDPFYYRELIELNRQLNRSDENAEVYRIAKARFLETLRGEISVELWQKTWSNLTLVMVNTNEFSDLLQRLKAELEKIENLGNPEDFGKMAHLRELISFALVANYRYQTGPDEKINPGDLEFLRQAYQYNPRDAELLSLLATAGFSDNPQVSAAAKAIYDPTDARDPPPSVLMVMGTEALKQDLYQEAIDHFEQTLRKGMRTNTVLNNLAYAYLKNEPAQPERALNLVNEAIRRTPNDASQNWILSRLYDTQGNALKQLKRYDEAIVAFRSAFQDRPNNRLIVESLIECYEAANLDPSIYRDHLKNLEESENP